MALELVAAGCQVIGVGRSQDALAELSKIKGIECRRCDVTDEDQVHELFKELAPRKLDFLINNAGIAHELKNVGELSLREFERVIATNLTSMFHVTSHALGSMTAGGLIINVISQAATTPFVGFSAYNASKAGTLAFSNTLREELRQKGIRVTALVPGAIETEIWNQFWTDAPKEKMVKAATVGKLVAHICSLPAEASIDQVTIAPLTGVL